MGERRNIIKVNDHDIYYIHTEKYSPKGHVVNFRTQISSSQSEEPTMVFTRPIRIIRIANDVFSRVR